MKRHRNLKPCPWCGKNVGEPYVHPEWDEHRGLVYGVLIHHKCEVMDVGIFATHYYDTEDEARTEFIKKWNSRKGKTDVKCDSSKTL